MSTEREARYTEAIHVELWRKDEAGNLCGDVARAVMAVADAEQAELRAEVDAEMDRLEGRILGDEQCCPDVCDGGACESCPGCCAGWCINGHDFRGNDEWDRMSDEDRAAWFNVAREHNPGMDAALARAEAAEAELAALRGRIEALALNLERGDSIDRGVAAGLHALAVAPAEDTTPAAPHAEDGRPTLDEIDPRLIEALRPLVARYGDMGVKHTVDKLRDSWDRRPAPVADPSGDLP